MRTAAGDDTETMTSSAARDTTWRASTGGSAADRHAKAVGRATDDLRR